MNTTALAVARPSGLAVDPAVPSSIHPLRDQAAGLRLLFGTHHQPVIGVVSNAHTPWSGLLLEHVLVALAGLGRRPLMIDASPTAAPADEWTQIDLRWAQVHRLEHHRHVAARGLIGRFLAEGRSPAAILRSAREAAEDADLLVLHAPADDLGRLLADRPWQPLLLADSETDGLIQAYANLKRLARWRLPAFNLLIDSSRHPSLGPRMVGRLDAGARRFLGWPLNRAVVVHEPPQREPHAVAQLRALLAEQPGVSRPH